MISPKVIKYSLSAAAMMSMAVAALCGCISRHEISVADVNPSGWSALQPASVVYQNEDTLRHADIYVMLRYDGSMPLGSVPLRVEVTSPDSLTTVEYIEIGTMSRRGESDMYEAQSLYRSAAVLNRCGKYTFTIAPQQEISPVRGINAVGIVLQ